MQLSRATQHLGRSNNMRCCPHYGKAARPPIHRCTRATRVLRACNQPHKTPVAEQQPLHKRMAMWALASVAAAALAAPLPANADGLVQTVPPDQMLSAAKPLPKQQVNKGKVWLIFVLGAASLFGTAVVMENNRTFFPAISRANRAMAVTRRQEEKQEAVDDAYLRSLEAGAGVPPLPAQLSDPSYFPSSGNPTSTTTSAAVGVDTVDEETARLTAAVQAGLAQASQRVASSSSNAGSSAEGAAADIQRVQAESIPTPGPAEYPAQLQAEDATPTQDAAAPSPSSPLYTPNGATVSTSAITPSQDPSSGYVVVTEQDPAALAGATVLQQVQSIATAGVQQSRVAVKQLQKGLEAAKARGDQSSSSQ